MIRGIVTADGEATIDLKVRGHDGGVEKIKAVIDTGYTGWLTLPASLTARLGLAWSRRGLADLADGSEIAYDVYDATVVWDRSLRSILVDEADTAPLIGMALLEGFELNVQVWSRGNVTITTRGRQSR